MNISSLVRAAGLPGQNLLSESGLRQMAGKAGTLVAGNLPRMLVLCMERVKQRPADSSHIANQVELLSQNAIRAFDIFTLAAQMSAIIHF
jgi:hypothetical protein